jgi:hypothetical protein
MESERAIDLIIPQILSGPVKEAALMLVER